MSQMPVIRIYQAVSLATTMFQNTCLSVIININQPNLGMDK